MKSLFRRLECPRSGVFCLGGMIAWVEEFRSLNEAVINFRAEL